MKNLNVTWTLKLPGHPSMIMSPHSSSGCYAYWISSPIYLPPYVCIPGLFSPSPKCFWDSAIWIHVSVVHLFSLLDNIIFYEYTIIYSSPVDGYLGCLHFFLDNTNVILNMLVYIPSCSWARVPLERNILVGRPVEL